MSIRSKDHFLRDPSSREGDAHLFLLQVGRAFPFCPGWKGRVRQRFSRQDMGLRLNAGRYSTAAINGVANGNNLVG